MLSHLEYEFKKAVLLASRLAERPGLQRLAREQSEKAMRLAAELGKLKREGNLK